MYDQTCLWKVAFDPRQESSGEAALRNRFKGALVQMRLRVGAMVAGIANDVPGLAIHDLTHLDALWEMADLMTDGGVVTLNPAEGFVLGGAILLHDAGLAVASYPGGLADLMETPEWRDRAEIERRALSVDFCGGDRTSFLPDTSKRAILFHVLRELHAKNAGELGTRKWSYGTKEGYLIEDSELREAYGEQIGLIASSHHWPMAQVSRVFRSPIGAFPGGPFHWTVNVLLMACLLRAADAIHIDSRRAPRFSFMLSRPAGVSKLHWDFQSKILAPQRDRKTDNIVFTSSSAFGPAEADAWWLCYDWIRMCAQELQDIDDALREANTTRLRTRNVEGAASADAFRSYVKVVGWHPVESSLRISDIPGLVRRLGGAALYGNSPEVALRELVQNAADAIRARATLVPNYHGCIVVEQGDDENGPWLRIDDDGIGMSERTLTSTLLDFGNSFWRSDDVTREFPGLVGRGFRAGGRFGIGFFSVFMLGNYVTVTSRRYDYGFGDTRRLEFRSGLDLRPILLTAPGDSLPQGGTRVEVRLKDNTTTVSPSVVKQLFPALAVRLAIRDECSQLINVVAPGDWLTISPKELFTRAGIQEDAAKYPLSLIRDKDTVYGRAAVRHHGASSQDGVLVDELGIRIGKIEGFVGIVRGIPTNVARTSGTPLVPQGALAAWATEQATLLTSMEFDNSEKIFSAAQVLCAGGHLGRMPFLSYRGTLINVPESGALIHECDEFWLFFTNYFRRNIAEVGSANTRWNTWYQTNVVFRAPAFFSNAEDRLLEIAEVSRKNVWDNPVTSLVRQIAAEEWGCPSMVRTDTVQMVRPKYNGEREEEETVLRFFKTRQ